MRAGFVKALAWVSVLAKLPTKEGHFTGDAAKDMTEAEALRIASRYERRTFSRGDSMSLAAIVHRSRQRRRARQTHPGKR